MKSLVVYYSHSGNTAYVAQRLLTFFSKHGDTDIVRVQYAHGSRNIFMRMLYRLLPLPVILEPSITDLKDYDVLCLGIPVLGAHPSSAMVKYLGMCQNLDRQKIVCCYIYGLEVSAWQCAGYVERLLRKKGQFTVTKLFIPWTHLQNEQLVDKTICEALAKLA